MVSVETSLEWVADFFAAEPLDGSGRFIRMLLLGLSVFGFGDPSALLLLQRPVVFDALRVFAIKTHFAELSSRAKGFQQKPAGSVSICVP
jgi:hypothetical protein